jgi:hypothetical protein
MSLLNSKIASTYEVVVATVDQLASSRGTTDLKECSPTGRPPSPQQPFCNQHLVLFHGETNGFGVHQFCWTPSFMDISHLKKQQSFIDTIIYGSI